MDLLSSFITDVVVVFGFRDLVVTYTSFANSASYDVYGFFFFCSFFSRFNREKPRAKRSQLLSTSFARQRLFVHFARFGKRFMRNVQL